ATGLLALLACGLRAAGPPAAATRPASAPADGRQLIRDRHFLAGFEAADPAPGKRVSRGLLQPPGARGKPAWWLVQWASRFSLAGATAAKRPGGGVEFHNDAKFVRLAPAGDDADVVLGVDARKEYRGQPYRKGTPWVHLLLEQELAPSPPLAGLRELRFSATFRLLKDQPLTGAAVDPAIHENVAQFQAYITVGNRNRASKGYGDYLWFGVPFYDNRYPSSPGGAMPDVGTGKFIYSPPTSVFTAAISSQGQWVTIDHDVLPLMLAGLEKARAQGFLLNSRDLWDLGVGSINIGWEMPGARDSAMQLRDLSLLAYPLVGPKPSPKPH
ncbi:MAG: hypothetical protein NTV86_17065, partial [Planctomycetota bacterium]|nr:hypothetical protein [Planctomycetota bacterium]